MEKIKLDDEKLQDLRAAITSHSEPTYYDEVLNDVRERADKHKYLTKLDLGALIAWKRIQANATWVNTLMMTPDAEAKAVTGEAFLAANDEGSLTLRADEARQCLIRLPGAGNQSTNAFASAVLTACHPELPVFDRRARSGLKKLELIETRQRLPYRRYVDLVDQIRVIGGFASNREVDLGLYWLGK